MYYAKETSNAEILVDIATFIAVRIVKTNAVW